MSEVGTDLMIVPATGEVVNLDSLPEVARALQSVKELESLLKEVKGTLYEAVKHHSRQQGTKTLHVEGVGKLEVKGGSETVYDAEAIMVGLIEAGIPEDRLSEIVETTVTHRVRAVEAKKAANANPAYRAVIEANSVVNEKRPTVSGP